MGKRLGQEISGIIPPIVTPFDENGEINYELLEAEMDLCLQAGVDGISVSGSTGEGPTIRDEELEKMVTIARAHCGSEKSVVCGVMRTCTRDAVRAGLVAKNAGADAIMVTPPAYNVLVPNAEGMFDFYSTISKEVQLPIIIYNVIPQNKILPDLFERLVNEMEYVRGIKQSVDGIQALYAQVLKVGSKGSVFAATDDMIFSCFELGAAGAISAILSVFPEECVKMWKLAKEGKHEEGLAIQNSLYDKWQCLGGNQFPIRLKYALECRGRHVGLCRSPITYLPEEYKEKIRKAFAE